MVYINIRRIIMKIKNILLVMFSIALSFGLLLIGCSGNEPGGDEFISSTNETISNNIETFGLTGETASSNKENVATVVIASGKIKITSVAEGIAIITVSDSGGHNATINISVSKNGSITIGEITKYSEDENPFKGTWNTNNPTLNLPFPQIEFEDNTFVFKQKLSGSLHDFMKGNYSYTTTSLLFDITHVSFHDEDESGNILNERWLTKEEAIAGGMPAESASQYYTTTDTTYTVSENSLSITGLYGDETGPLPLMYTK
jgi:hypothetical protein